MGKDLVMNIVASDCAADKEAAFIKWYNEVHIPMLFKYQGMKRVTRYQLIGESKEQARYLACYEYESKEDMEALHQSPEFAAAIEEMRETWKDGGFEIKWAAQYEPIKSWER